MKIVVYTVIVDGYDTLQPTHFPSICLTDGYLPPVKGWEMRRIRRRHRDLRRSSRHPKMLPHLYFPDADYTIYTDGNILLTRDPEEVVTNLLKTHDMALYSHPQRSCVYQEADKCIEYNKANRRLVISQMRHYARRGLPREDGLAACWVIVRKNTPEVRRFGERWWEEYGHFSRRDQLSFVFTRWLLGTKYDKIPGNLFSEYEEGDYFKRTGWHTRSVKDA